jgi:hypothetical protein
MNRPRGIVLLSTPAGRRGIVLFALTGLLFLTGWLLFRRVEHTPPIVREWGRQAQKTAAAWPVAPFDTPEGRTEAGLYLVSKLPQDIATRYDRASIELGAASIVGFLGAQTLGTFERYTEWANGHGLVIRDQWPDSPRFGEDSFQRSYRGLLGIPDDSYRCAPLEFFRDIYAHNQTAGDGAYVPHGISTGDDSAHILVATFTHASDTFDYDEDLLFRPPGARFWAGGVVWSWLPFTEPPNTMKEIIDKHGEATVMRVLLVIVGKSGLKMPTDIYQCYDPDRGQWFVYQVLQSNFGRVAGTGPAEEAWGVF